MKKKFMGIALVLASVLFVGNVYAAELWSKFGTVTDVTSSDAYIGDKPVSKIENKNGDMRNTTVMFTSGDFVILGETTTTAGTRDADNSWVGVQVSVPEGVSESNYGVKIDGEEAGDNGIKTSSSFTEYFGVSLARLEENLGGYIAHSLEFDWNNDGTYDQYVSISIDPMGVSLYQQGTTSKDESKALWTPEIAKAKLAVKEAEEKEAERIEKEQEIVAAVVSADEEGVSVVGTLLSKDDDVYKTMVEKLNSKGFDTVFGAYELKTESEIGENGITLTFNVGTDNNGKAAYILHQKKDGTFEEFEGIVKDGVVKITVKELSPFMIALGNVVKDDEPGTNDIDISLITLAGMLTIGASGAYIIKKAREN